MADEPPPEDFQPLEPNARCVTPFGLGSIVAYSAEGHTYQVLVDDGSNAYLQVAIVTNEFQPKVDDKVATPFGTGTVKELREDDASSKLLHTAHFHRC